MRELSYDANSKMLRGFPQIKKLGAISPNGESSPFVWDGRLMRLENEDPSRCYSADAAIRTIIRDCATNEILSRFGGECDFTSFYQEDGVAYILGSLRGQRDTIVIYESRDLINWSEPRILLQRPGWAYCNTALVKGPDGYVLLLEADSRDVSQEVANAVGHFYTFFFATSPDMVNWTHLELHKCYNPDRYSGAPWMTYVNGWYYVINLIEMPGPIYTSYLSRTQDFDTWYLGKYNPILLPSQEDKLISPNAAELSEELLEEMKTAYISSNADIDMCEFEGKTRIVYNAGNQLGFYYLAEAVYDGPLSEFLERQFE